MGSLDLPSYRRLLAAAHSLTALKGYQDLVLDFSSCIAAYPGPMIAICAQSMKWRSSDTSVQLILPTDTKLARLFINANWAHNLDPTRFKQSAFRGYTHVPAACFASALEQHKQVNRMIDAVLCSLTGIERGDLAAIEWSLNEITDNVLVHSRAESGGIVQLNSFKQRRRIEFCVADAGAGIPTTLREGFPDIKSDIEALERAIREGVTRDPKVGQGNGLYGTMQVARTSQGYLHIHSGYARLAYEGEQLRLADEAIRYSGTLIVACMDCSKPTALADALRFSDTKYEPLDYIDTHYETRDSDNLIFRMHEEALSYGSRTAGDPVRTKLHNLIYMNPGRRIVVDLSEVQLVSSSFADEVFGKLFKALGPLRFMNTLDLQVNIAGDGRTVGLKS